ncbi:MAG: SpoIIE family protein phosphatase [Bacteroidales bacterium]
MKKAALTLLVILFFASGLEAQKGVPYITYFNESAEMETGNWAVVQDETNVMIFANKRGLLTYDGHQWRQLSFKPTLSVMEKDPINGHIFVGADNSYGVLEKNEQGGYDYNRLSGDTTAIGLIADIMFTDTTVIFCSPKSISVHRLDDLSSRKRWYADADRPFSGLITHNGKLFFNVHGTGLYRIDADTLFPLVTGFLTRDKEVLFSFPYDDEKRLVGTSGNKLQLFDRVIYSDYKMDNPEYLEENILSGAVMVNDSTIALTTLYGGIMLIEKETGKMVNIFNYQNGLPDDEIYSAGIDNNGGLWITHRYGVCRVDLRLPVASFNHYPGLEGSVLTVLKNGNSLYIGTNEGLFHLDQVSEYDNVEVLYRIPPSEDDDTEEVKEDSSEANRPAMRFFNRLFSGGGTQTREIESQETTAPVAEPEPKVQYGKRTVRVLKSLKYIYRPVSGINSSIRQTVDAGYGMLVVSSAGIYYVENDKATYVPVSGSVNSIARIDDQHFLVCMDKGLTAIEYDGKKWNNTDWMVKTSLPVKNVAIMDESHLWLGSENRLYSVMGRAMRDSCAVKGYEIQSGYPVEFDVAFAGDTLFALSEAGIYRYDNLTDTFISYAERGVVPGNYYKYLMTDDHELLVRVGEKWQGFGNSSNEATESILRLFDNPAYISSDEDGALWVVDKNSMVYKIDDGDGDAIRTDFNMFIAGVNGSSNSYFNLDNIVFDPDEKAITLDVRAPYYLKETSTMFQYRIEGLMDEWSDWSSSQRINLFLKPGEYTVYVRAMNILGEVSNVKMVEFTIDKPFVQTIAFYLLAGISVAFVFVMIVSVREKKLRHDKMVLEEKVRQRTEEISKQKEYIEHQRDEIIFQKEEITSSITYASRIQTAMLPDISSFTKVFKDSFILFRPRDIVSGDFYWIAGSDDFTYFTAADCTGHGVPGAFMSMLGMSFLSEITGDGKIDLKPSDVLNQLRKKVIMSLSRSRRDGLTFDGMDIALCKYNHKKNSVEFAGAFNPMYHFRGGELTVFKADRMPVGRYIAAAESFTNHETKVESGDVIYLFSDGFADQFGGADCKKYGQRNLRADLTAMVDLPMDEQKKLLNKKFETWKNDQNQVDDVILLGVRF